MAKKNKKIAGRKKKTRSRSRLMEFWDRKKGIFKISLVLLLLTCFLLTFSTTDWFLLIREPLTIAFAFMGGLVLDILGFATTVKGTAIFSSKFSVDIKQGCDAVAPIFVYVSTILVFPTTWHMKLKGLIYGLLAMTIMNVIRIVTLFISGVYFPDLFSFLHYRFWQVLFVVFVAALWIIWFNNIEHAEKNSAKTT